MASYTVRQATMVDLEEVAQLFDLYRIFYEQKSDINDAKQFYPKELGKMNRLFLL